MVRRPALFDELDASLAAVVPREAVEFAGSWLPSERRTYQAAGHAGTGSGPLIDVLDLRWRGTLACAIPIAGIAFLVTVDDIFWVKSAPATPVQPVDVSFHAHATDSAGPATFTAGIGGSVLPGVPIADGSDVIAGLHVGVAPVDDRARGATRRVGRRRALRPAPAGRGRAGRPS